ncbi:unnamed protein product [Adineta ricciae]|uniref:Ig-like domain-containing protein n=1 Tax=Adineta ricciae TaxID=249248 RepID=A0A813S975_ADIRI|nr:unnamed protein product [Adineta ricciae]
MTSSYPFPLLLSLFVSLTTTLVYTLEQNNRRVDQKILIGPKHINTYPGETVQFPCIVSKQSNAVVTWCWNDFCTLGKTQFLHRETVQNDVVNVYQYMAYPRFRLSINERLNHYNLSIIHVSNKDEGIFQCQVQRTMNANEARSERVHLTLIVPPTDEPTLILPNMPLRQGQPANITCSSAPSKPAATLSLYRNDELIDDLATSSIISYELDATTNRNITKLTYIINNPDSEWNNVLLKCRQMYTIDKKTSKFDVTAKIQVHYKPKARIESQNRYPLTINSTATFRCVIHGNPEPKLRWFANSMDLTSLTSPTINIPLSKHVHNHSIGCTAINSVGTTNTSIRLLVRYPPILVVRPPKVVVLDLHSKSSLNPTILRCIVDSYPRAKIIWSRYGEMVGEGSTFNLENITKREQQGVYSYRIETDGYDTIKHDFVLYIKGKPLVYIHESRQFSHLFECQVYSSSPILSITWKLNDRPIQSNDQLSTSTTCEENVCTSKLLYDYRKLVPSSQTLSHLSCIGENEFGIEQSRLYQLNTSNDPSMILVSILLSTFLLIIIFSLIAIYCCCRARLVRRRQKNAKAKKLPLVFDEHYSINELLKEVGSLKTCNTSLNNTDQLSLKMESADHLLTKLFNKNTQQFLDTLSSESSTNSSSFHSKSTTTISNHEYSPRLTGTTEFTYFGRSPLYSCQDGMNV